ncbi:MAG TPA: hypothetical protein VFN03_09580 [Trueperaceae bacterium]|nr:hypothetical protein [Trueperaceae bacterium]
MASLASVAVLPLVGPFHTRWPRYTVVHVRQMLASFEPDVVALAPLAAGDLKAPTWQDTDEVALPHTVVPWASRRGTRLVEVGLATNDPLDPGDDRAADDLERYLDQYEAGQRRLAQVRAAEAPVRQLLTGSLDLGRVRGELLPAITSHQARRESVLGKGPGTRWLEERAALMASRTLASGGRRIALLAGVDLVPSLSGVLAGHADLVELAEADAGEEGEQRALLDVAMRAEATDSGALLRRLAELDVPEARYHEANLLLADSRPEEALDRLLHLLRLDFQEPYYLPGFALARIGQLYDLAQRREEALKSYRGVLALSWAPAAAVAAATAGIASPFGLYDVTDE